MNVWNEAYAPLTQHACGLLAPVVHGQVQAGYCKPLSQRPAPYCVAMHSVKSSHILPLLKIRDAVLNTNARAPETPPPQLVLPASLPLLVLNTLAA
jgi:hypothetical protein